MSDGARVGANDGSNPSNVGAIPTAPAIKFRAPEILEPVVNVNYKSPGDPLFDTRVVTLTRDEFEAMYPPVYIDNATGI